MKYDNEDRGSGDWNINVNNHRFISDMAENVKVKHGMGAHLYAVEKVMQGQEAGDDLLVNIWKEVLEELDKLNESEV
jgi:hypothetical protein